MASYSNILAWKIPWTEECGGLCPWGHKMSDATEWLSRSTTYGVVGEDMHVC